MKNWRTTLLGILTGIGLLNTGVKMIVVTGTISQESIGLIVSGISAILLGYHAKDGMLPKGAEDDKLS